MKTTERAVTLHKFNFKTIIIPIILLLIGLFFIFGSEIFTSSSNSEKANKLEARLVEMINDLDGVSNSEVMLLTDNEGKVTGAAVICNGGNLSENKMIIIEMITSLFNVGACDVFVGGK